MAQRVPSSNTPRRGNRNLLLGVVLASVLAVVGVAVWLLTAPRAADTPLAAATIAVPTRAAAATPDVTQDAASTEVTAEAQAATMADAAVLYEIDPAFSQARFELDEELGGVPTHVVGSTTSVVGQVLVDFANPSASQVGQIVIDARSFATDSALRDGAIARSILQSGQFQTITFTPTALEGLPATSTGDTATFRILGDLTIRGMTQPVTFEASVTPSADRATLDGEASTTVLRSAYSLQIPNVPRVANVTDEVVLTIQFRANAVTSGDSTSPAA